MPSASSSVSASVGMTEISSSGPPAPNRMTEPLPNCRSICEIASSRACRRSFLLSAIRGLLGVCGWMGPSRISLTRMMHACILGARPRTRQCPAMHSVIPPGRVALALHALVERLPVHTGGARQCEPVRPVRLLAADLEIEVETGRRETGPGVAPSLGGAAGQQAEAEYRPDPRPHGRPAC